MLDDMVWVHFHSGSALSPTTFHDKVHGPSPSALTLSLGHNVSVEFRLPLLEDAPPKRLLLSRRWWAVNACDPPITSPTDHSKFHKHTRIGEKQILEASCNDKTSRHQNVRQLDSALVHSCCLQIVFLNLRDSRCATRR